MSPAAAAAAPVPARTAWARAVDAFMGLLTIRPRSSVQMRRWAPGRSSRSKVESGPLCLLPSTPVQTAATRPRGTASATPSGLATTERSASARTTVAVVACR